MSADEVDVALTTIQVSAAALAEMARSDESRWRQSAVTQLRAKLQEREQDVTGARARADRLQSELDAAIALARQHNEDVLNFRAVIDRLTAEAAQLRVHREEAQASRDRARATIAEIREALGTQPTADIVKHAAHIRAKLEELKQRPYMVDGQLHQVVLHRDQLSTTVQAVRTALQAPGGVELVEHAAAVRNRLATQDQRVENLVASNADLARLAVAHREHAVEVEAKLAEKVDELHDMNRQYVGQRDRADNHYATLQKIRKALRALPETDLVQHAKVLVDQRDAAESKLHDARQAIR
jgi:chromosome segregation ATPase